MADEPNEAGAAAPPPEDQAAESASATVNSQIVDAISLLNTLTLGQAPAAAAGMVGMMTADSLALGMLNAVARQQADAIIASAAMAAACARMAGTSLPAGASGDLVQGAEAQARAAILTLGAGAAGADAAAAKAALQRIAEAATKAAEGPPAPPAAARRGKSGTGQ